jgi:hypothetical protein
MESFKGRRYIISLSFNQASSASLTRLNFSLLHFEETKDQAAITQ